jgi:ABC-type bacteriocin/lantibiotic exporter with double-glycine peptidase domain
MQQSEGIREFLAGRLFLTLLDALSLLVFVPLPLSYSAKLTLIVLGFALMVALLVAVTVGPYKQRLTALYESEALRQGLIVETVHGMRTNACHRTAAAALLGRAAGPRRAAAVLKWKRSRRQRRRSSG